MSKPLGAMPEPDDDDLMTTEEAAAFLRLRPNTLEIWRSKRTGPSYLRIGGRIHYRRSRLRAWRDAQEVETIDSARAQ